MFEFYTVLMEKLENEMKSSEKGGSFIRQELSGSLRSSIVGECGHRSSSEEAFLALNINVQNQSQGLIEGLDQFVEGEVLEGDNAYFCEKCAAKVKAEKRVSFVSLPNHLVLVLKRFEFDFETQSKIKINDYFQFPEQLDLSSYLQTPEQLDLSSYLPQLYSLGGVIIHLGIADAGHYYSLIKDRHTQQWLEFNDHIVQSFDINTLPKQAFGTTNNNDYFTNIRNAYLIIYDKNPT